MELSIEPVGPPTQLGEAPYWDKESQTLFYVDALKKQIHSYNPKTRAHHAVDVYTSDGEAFISIVVKVKGEKNKFVISNQKSLFIVTWDGVSSECLKPEELAMLEDGETRTMFNDGKCDPSNRLWIGTRGGLQLEDKDNWMEKEKGSVYSLQMDKTFRSHLPKITLANGLTWSPDKKKFYHIDSFKFRVDGFDYDDASGEISKEKQVFSFVENKIEGLPDGMTIDQEGMIWVACFGSGQVLRIDPNSGKLLRTVKLPSPQTTSVVFGGPNLEDLYVTSGTEGLPKEAEGKYPLAGCTFRVTGLGAKGIPSVPIQL